MRRLTVLIPLLVSFVSSVYGQEPAQAPAASVQFKAWVLAKFPSIPWGLGIDSMGNIYVSLPVSSEVVMLKEDGSYEHIAWVPSKEETGKGRVIGIDLDKADNIYVAHKALSKYDKEDLVNPLHPACRDATVVRTGVYKIDAKTRQVTALATRAGGWLFCWPHDVAADSQGNVYMADLTYPAIRGPRRETREQRSAHGPIEIARHAEVCRSAPENSPIDADRRSAIGSRRDREACAENHPHAGGESFRRIRYVGFARKS